MKGEKEEGRPLPTACRSARDLLSQFADNEMSGAQAIRIAGHLNDCAACQCEYQRLIEMKAALRRGSEISPQDSEATRTRVLARMERAALQEPVPAPSFLTMLFGGSGLIWRPMAATCAAVGLIGAAYFAAPRPALTTLPARRESVSAPLPDAEEMQALVRLHEAHGSTTAWDEPVARRDARASAQAELLQVADANVAGSL